MEVGNVFSSVFTGKDNQPTSEKILGKDDFLRLLVTQLNYQDPLNPLEAADFSAQLAQFSSVEQLANIGQTLQASQDSDLLLATSINNTLAATIIGKSVRAQGNQVYFDGEQPANLSFSLPSNAREVTIEIVNENGKVVRTIQQKNLAAGDHTVSWDGRDDDGADMPEGTYTFRVSAQDGEGNPLDVTTYLSGRITGVRYGQGGAVLMVGHIEIALSDVYEILEG
ncbi:MAG: flagellar hook capping protein [Calditrichaeota bacterium]|nr:MAG: flagellar hook capping protein [Calditrichota bacterium]